MTSAERSRLVTPDEFAGLSLARPLIMGIVNVTPDSFSDAGETAQHQAAIERGAAMLTAGADIIDIGGESTRPGAIAVEPEHEWRRVGPVVSALADLGATVSIDTRHAQVMASAVSAGAKIINDVTALTGDRDSLDVAKNSGAAIILMHMRGLPGTMNDEPIYRDVVGEVRDYLIKRVVACQAAGIDPQRLAIDPGIGFGKTMAHNYALLEKLSEFRDIAAALMVGISRKFGNPANPDQRREKSLSLAAQAAASGAQILRVHDVPETISHFSTATPV